MVGQIREDARPRSRHGHASRVIGRGVLCTGHPTPDSGATVNKYRISQWKHTTCRIRSLFLKLRDVAIQGTLREFNSSLMSQNLILNVVLNHFKQSKLFVYFMLIVFPIVTKGG